MDFHSYLGSPWKPRHVWCVSADLGSIDFTGARFGAEAEMRHEEVDLMNFLDPK